MIIAIDTGHGGSDYGAICEPLIEKHLNVEFAAAITKALDEKLGGKHEVIYIRYGDNRVTLRNRCIIANQAKADVFISCHHNASKSHRGQGFEILHYPYSGLGKIFAKAVCKKVCDRISIKCRGVKPGWYRGQVGKHLTVLRHTKMPAIIIEAAFLDNKHDRDAYLLSGVARNALYHIIAKSISEVLDEGIV